MSRENVELVRLIILGPKGDIAQRIRDDEIWKTNLPQFGPLFADDFETVVVMPGGAERVYQGFDGLRIAWLDWLEPWESYRTQIQDLIELGDRVLALLRDCGTVKGTQAEVEVPVAAIWTIRDGQFTRAEFYASQSQALEAVGLRE
jgi:ketosteroid isomerase-like protein